MPPDRGLSQYNVRREEFEFLKARIQKMEEDMTIALDSVAVHIKISQSLKEDTKQFVELLEAVKMGLQFFIFAAKIAKWLTTICLGVAAVWAIVYAIKTGVPPALPSMESILHD